jgi:nitrogen regulatory protein P-II 1
VFEIIRGEINQTIERDNMKMIIAIIQPYKLEDVKKELYAAAVNLMTVSEVLGHGRQKGVTEVYRGAKETGNLLRKIRLEIAVNDNFVEPTVKAILKGAKTGETGDGKIFVMNLEECVRIRTGEKGREAIG